MRLYRILIPELDNSGKSNVNKLILWEMRVFDAVGGFTKGPIHHGKWRNPDGKVYSEAVIPYDVACPVSLWHELVGYARIIFADQQSFFTVDLGEATFVDGLTVDPGAA